MKRGIDPTVRPAPRVLENSFEALRRFVPGGELVQRGMGRLLRFRQLLSPTAGLSLLDVGGGNGAKTAILASDCAQTTVLDPDPRRIAQGRRDRPQLRFVEGVAERIPFPEASFDRVVFQLSFHHTGDQPTALGEVVRILRPGGRLVLYEVRPESWAGRLMGLVGGLVHRGGGPGHQGLRFLGPQEAMALAAQAGLAHPATERIGSGYFLTADKP